MKKHFLRLLFLTLFLIFTIYFISKTQNKNEFGSNLTCIKCNIILISIDPFRTANIHIYGYNKAITPNIDGFAKDSLFFTHTYSPSSWTLPAEMSLLTGKYPFKHKVLNKITITENQSEEVTNLKKLSPEIKTLAELLKDKGYKSAIFTGGAALDRQFGFDEGFEEYHSGKDFSGADFNRAFEWLRKNKVNNYFLFIQGFDLHGQFEPDEGFDFRFKNPKYSGKLTGSKEEQKLLREDALYSKKLDLTSDDAELLKSIYDEKLNNFDKKFGEFISNLKDLGIYNSSIIILTSSHGEEFYEHQRIDHGHSLYQELIRVPLILKIPGLKNIKIEQQISLIDIVPTLLDLTGLLGKNSSFDGKSIFPLKELKERQIFSETDYRYAVSLRSMITTDQWKIIKNIENGEKQLFNLKIDPNENFDLAEKNTKKLNELSEFLDKI